MPVQSYRPEIAGDFSSSQASRRRWYRPKNAKLLQRSSLYTILFCALICLASSSEIERIHLRGACWLQGDLFAKRGENLIDKRVTFVAPPQASHVKNSADPRNQQGVVRRVDLPQGKRLVALTFDLCELPDEVTGYQGEIVDYLRLHDVKATFFVGGKWMLTHRERTRQLMFDPLFELANHTWEHRNLRILDGPNQIAEIEQAQRAYEQVREELEAKECFARDGAVFSHERPRARMSLFRFPYGACNAESLSAVADSGLLAIQWDVSSGDAARSQTAERIQSAVLKDVRPGSIVLFHLNGRGRNTGTALPGIINRLRSQGYDFVTVSELLKAGEPVFASSCYISHPGDTDHYDKLARRLDSRFRRSTAFSSRALDDSE